jgi:hypothetical protein
MERYGSKLIKYRFENNLVIVTAVFFSLNAIKPWIDIFFGISNQLITGLQLILLLLSFLYFLLHTRENISIWTFLILSYICLRYFSELQIMLFTEFKLESLVAATYSVVRIAMFFLFLQVLSFNLSRRCIDRLKNIFLSYFMYTVLISALQHPLIFDVSNLRNFGGNHVSGNGLEIFRATGGIGGTVIGYANYLLSVCWLVIFGSYKYHHFGKLISVALIFSVFVCFSRSVFLSVFVIYFFLMIFNFKKSHALYLILLLLVGLTLDFDSIRDAYSVMIASSDASRIDSWVRISNNLGLLTVLVGNQVGQNTGLLTGGMVSLSGDSFLLGTLNDFGLIGVLLFVGATWSSFQRFKFGLNVQLGMFTSFMLMLFINSGFEKLTVMFSYALVLAIIRGLHVDKPISGIKATQ